MSINISKFAKNGTIEAGGAPILGSPFSKTRQFDSRTLINNFSL